MTDVVDASALLAFLQGEKGADTVEEVLEIPESQVEPPPRFKTVSGRERYIAGMGKVGEEVKILLDVEKLVRDEDVRAVAEAAAEPR